MSDGKSTLRISPEQQRSRRSRNIALSLILAGLCVLFYVITIVKLGGNILARVGM
jgi:hypothetical protein